jgi:hypothetical protein
MGLKWPAWPHALATASLSEALYWPRPWQVWCLFAISLAVALAGWATAPETLSLDRIRARQTNAFESPSVRGPHRSWDGLAVIEPVAGQLGHWATRNTATDTVLQFSGAPGVVRGLILRLASVGVISSYVLKTDAPRSHQAAVLNAELHMADAWVAWTPQRAADFMQPLGLVVAPTDGPRSVQSPGEATLPAVAPLKVEGLLVLATVSGPSGAYAVIQAPEGLLRVRAGELIGGTGAKVIVIRHQHVQLANGMVLPWR